MVKWLEPQTGLVLKVQQITLESEFQVGKLSSAGIDPRIYGGFCDPAFFIGLSIQAGIDSGISAEGNINMLTQLIQHQQVLLGERLEVSGQISSVEPVPRGHRISTSVVFRNDSGEAVISVHRESLKPDLNRNAERGAGQRPEPVVQDVRALRRSTDYQLTPEATQAYSREGNAIHYEVEAAQKAGFRAPIIGGGQGVHFLTAEVWGQGIASLDFSIYFRRPIFWDQSLWVGVDPKLQSMALVSGDKVLTEIKVNSLERLNDSLERLNNSLERLNNSLERLNNSPEQS